MIRWLDLNDTIRDVIALARNELQAHRVFVMSELAGDLPLPIALLKRDAVDHNLAWMQRQVGRWGIDLAPHGKTTM